MDKNPWQREPAVHCLQHARRGEFGLRFLTNGVSRVPEQTWFQFDKQQGIEKLWLVFSKDAVPELEATKQFASRRTAGLITDPSQNQAVKNFINTHSATNTDVQKGDKLTTLKAPGTVLLYPIRLEHH